MSLRSNIHHLLTLIAIAMAFILGPPSALAEYLDTDYVEFKLAMFTEDNPEVLVRQALIFGGADEALIEEVIPLFFDQGRPEWREEAEAFIGETNPESSNIRHIAAQGLRIELGLADEDRIPRIFLNARRNSELEIPDFIDLKLSEQLSMYALDGIVYDIQPPLNDVGDHQVRLGTNMSPEETATLREEILASLRELRDASDPESISNTAPQIEEMCVAYLHQTGDVAILREVYDMLNQEDIPSIFAPKGLRFALGQNLIRPMYFLKDEALLEELGDILVNAPPSRLEPVPGELGSEELIQIHHLSDLINQHKETAFGQRLLFDVLKDPPRRMTKGNVTFFRRQFVRLIKRPDQEEMASVEFEALKRDLWRQEVQFHEALQSRLFSE